MFTDNVNVWVYEHFPVLPAVAELILLFFPFFRKIEKNNESYNRLLPAAVRNEIEKNEINKIKRFYGLVIAARPLIHVIVNNYGYIAIGNAEISRVYANAPPCAPPKKTIFTEFQIYEILQSLIPPILDELQDTEKKLRKEEVRNYVITKLTIKVAKNQRSYPLNFSNSNNFTIFEKNIKLCIQRQILPTLESASRRRNKKAQKITQYAAAAWYRWDVSMDETLPSLDNGKPTTYHDIIPSDTPDALQLLILKEQKRAEEAALAALTDDEKERLIAEYDATRRVETGELFEVETTEPAAKPVNPAKYRRQPKPVRAAEPLLFQGVTL